MRAPPLYIKTSKDPDLIPPYPPRKGVNKDENGHPRNGVYLQTFRKIEVKRYIRNGTVLQTFRYPRCAKTFHSALLNDYNQHLAGGWYWGYREDGSHREKSEFNNESIFERLLTGRKPLGGLRFWDDDQGKKEKFLRQLVNSDLSYARTREKGEDFFAVSRRGKLGNLFDFDKISADYIALEKGSGCGLFGPRLRLERFLCSTAKKKLESYLNFDHFRPASAFDFLITGLILGYPLENTYALLLTKYSCNRR